ncbi:MAG: hypothetical protein ABI571_08215, partial [Actinomycetota bacterium]
MAALFVGALVIIFTDPESLRAWASFTANPTRAFSLSWQVASDEIYQSWMSQPAFLSAGRAAMEASLDLYGSYRAAS